MDTPLLIEIGDALASQGIAVVRFNFPYAEAGWRAPDPLPYLKACYHTVAMTVADEIPRLFVGGKSLGARIASYVVADGFPAAGLVFLGYPLHPPGRPQRIEIRYAHLGRIEVPMLFLQGTRDAFATQEVLYLTLETLKTAKLVEIAGGDHSFKVSGRPPVEVTAELVDAIVSFVSA